jgi:ferredoxin-type protein NapG
MNNNKASRRDFLTRAMRGTGVAAVGGSVWGYMLREQTDAAPFALRPPGAIPEDDFLATCIKCGQCAVDCPYDTLRLAAIGGPYPLGTPFFEPRTIPCYMCPDIPCVKACPTGALNPALTEIRDADIGLAVLVDQENCLSYRGLRCEICHRDCPVQNEAITIERHSRKLSKHAVFVPIVHSDKCTGCGVCEKVCPLPVPAIKVMPRKLAQGKLGEHYEFGWESDTPITRDFQPAESAPEASSGDVEAGLDYLNEGGLE